MAGDNAPGGAGVPERDEAATPSAAFLGVRVAEIRASKGLSVRALARAIGLTPSSISQIEKGKVNPSVSTLFALAQTLGVSMDAFFAEQRGDGWPAALRQVVVTRSRRARIVLEGGVVWERLSPFSEPDVEFIETIYPPGAASSPAMQQHPGRDYGVLLEGQMRLHVGFEAYDLEAGDSFRFDASIPHRVVNRGTTTARAIWAVLTPPPRTAGDT